MTARAKVAKKVKPLPKYLYVAVSGEGGAARNLIDWGVIADTTVAGSEALAGWKNCVRYVLESSVRPGGKS